MTTKDQHNSPEKLKTRRSPKHRADEAIVKLPQKITLANNTQEPDKQNLQKAVQKTRRHIYQLPEQ